MGEEEHVESLASELDWFNIEQILKERFDMALHDDIEFRNGDIVVHENELAYKVDFDVRVTLSLIFGRDGQCLDIRASGDDEEQEEED